MKQKYQLLLLTVMFSLLLTLFALADCGSDLYIDLAYPNDLDVTASSGSQHGPVHESYLPFVGSHFSGDKRPETAPHNTGMIWVPKEACGKTDVDLLIALHGWRSLTLPEGNIYLKDPTQKQFDKIVREAIDSGKSKPIIIAAPMHDRGPEENVFTPNTHNPNPYDINQHIALIKEALDKEGIGAQISRVSLIGHSNANCGGGLARAAQELTNYPLYFYGAADGTCGNGDYVSDVIPALKQKGTILFQMHQKSTNSDINSGNTIKKESGGIDPGALYTSEYNEAWKSNDGKFYTYAVKSKGTESHTHTTIPMDLLKEVLPRFFSPQGLTGQAVASSGTFPGSLPNSAPVQTGTLVPKNVPQRQKEVDEVWQKISIFIGGLGANKIWDNTLGPFDWRNFNDVYFQKVAGNAFATAGLPSGYLYPTTDLSGCKVTQTNINTQAIGSSNDGSLINGITTQTDSFLNLKNNGYSTTTNSVEPVEYGTIELIQLLELTSCALRNKYGVKLVVKDRSLSHGGIVYKNQENATAMSPEQWKALPSGDKKYEYAIHLSHQDGREVDLGYFFVENNILKNTLTSIACGAKTCNNAPISAFTDLKALEANWYMLKTMDEIFPLQSVFFDKYLIYELHQYACNNEGNTPAVQKFFGDCPAPAKLISDPYTTYTKFILKHLSGHADHYHLYIKCPQGDSQCSGQAADRGITYQSGTSPGTSTSFFDCTGITSLPNADRINRINTVAFNSGGKTRKQIIIEEANVKGVEPALIAAHATLESQMGKEGEATCTGKDGLTRSSLTGCGWSSDCKPCKDLNGECDGITFSSDQGQIACTASLDQNINTPKGNYNKCNFPDESKKMNCFFCVYSGNYDDTNAKLYKDNRKYFLKDSTCNYAENMKSQYCEWKNYFTQTSVS